MQGLVALALLLGSPSSPKPVPEVAGPARVDTTPGASLRAYLRRPVPRSARFVDHGVLTLRTLAGSPSLYRFDLQLGLFDHVSVGVTAHWVPGQRVPQVWPVGSIAIVRWQGAANIGVEIGARYEPVLYPPPDEGAFIPQTHMALGSFVLSAGWFSAGLDLGAAHTRIPVVDPADIASFRRRVVFAGGPFARFGNRRVGFGIDAVAVLSPEPLLVFELGLDARFGLFEERGRGGWAGRER
jgi:hypothetical protein